MSLFSPKPSHDLALPPGESGLFAELFPGSLLFPSPCGADADACPAGGLASAFDAAAAVEPARLPGKLFDQLPHVVDAAKAAVAAAAAKLEAAEGRRSTGFTAAAPAAARNLLGQMDSCATAAAAGSDGSEQPSPSGQPSPKRRR